MPISIYKEECGTKLAFLSDEDWNLPRQIDALEKWLEENKSEIDLGDYVADIGFSVREEASGGGAVLSPAAMKTMGSLGMTLFLSEYPKE
ncbi:MAG: hypothetical protein ABJN22_07760 [Litorimonas sp.]